MKLNRAIVQLILLALPTLCIAYVASDFLKSEFWADPTDGANINRAVITNHFECVINGGHSGRFSPGSCLLHYPIVLLGSSSDILYLFNILNTILLAVVIFWKKVKTDDVGIPLIYVLLFFSTGIFYTYATTRVIEDELLVILAIHTRLFLSNKLWHSIIMKHMLACLTILLLFSKEIFVCYFLVLFGISALLGTERLRGFFILNVLFCAVYLGAYVYLVYMDGGHAFYHVGDFNTVPSAFVSRLLVAANYVGYSDSFGLLFLWWGVWHTVKRYTTMPLDRDGVIPLACLAIFAGYVILGMYSPYYLSILYIPLLQYLINQRS